MTTTPDLPADAEPLTADEELMTAAAPGSTLLRIQLRRDTADAWTAANPVLGAGEQGLETDTGKQKVGNGANAWVDLPYEVSRPDLALKANASTVAGKQDKATLGADAATALQTPGNALYVAGRAASVSAVQEAPTAAIGGQWDFTLSPTVGGLPIGGAGNPAPAGPLSAVAKAATGPFRVFMTGTSISTFDRAPNQVLVETLKTMFGDGGVYPVRFGVAGGSYTSPSSGWDKQPYGGPSYVRLRGSSSSTALTYTGYFDTLVIEWSQESDGAAVNVSIDGAVVGTVGAAGAQAYSQATTFNTTLGPHTVVISPPTSGYSYLEHMEMRIAARTGVDVRDATYGGSKVGDMTVLAAPSGSQVAGIPIVSGAGIAAHFNRPDVDLFIVHSLVNDAGTNQTNQAQLTTVYKPALDAAVATVGALGKQMLIVVEMAGHYAMPNDGGNNRGYTQFNAMRAYLLSLSKYNWVTVIDHHGATAMTDLAAYAARYYSVSGLNLSAGTYTGDFVHAQQPGPQIGTDLIHRAVGLPAPKRSLASLVLDDRIKTTPGTFARDQLVTIAGTARRVPTPNGVAVQALGAGGGVTYQNRLVPYYRDLNVTNLAASTQTSIDSSGTSDAYGTYLTASSLNVGLGNAVNWAGGATRTFTIRASGPVEMKAGGVSLLLTPAGQVVTGSMRWTPGGTGPAVYSVTVGGTAANGFITVTGQLYEIAITDSNAPILIKNAPSGGNGPTGPTGPAGGVGAPLISGNYANACMFGALTSNTLTLGQAYTVPFVPLNAGNLDRLGIDIATGVAGALIRLALWASDGTNRPATKLVSTEQLDASTSGFKESATFASLVPVTAGTLYWISAALQGTAAATPRTINGTSPLISVGNSSYTGFQAYQTALAVGNDFGSTFGSSFPPSGQQAPIVRARSA